MRFRTFSRTEIHVCLSSVGEPIVIKRNKMLIISMQIMKLKEDFEFHGTEREKEKKIETKG